MGPSSGEWTKCRGLDTLVYRLWDRLGCHQGHFSCGDLHPHCVYGTCAEGGVKGGWGRDEREGGVGRAGGRGREGWDGRGGRVHYSTCNSTSTAAQATARTVQSSKRSHCDPSPDCTLDRTDKV